MAEFLASHFQIVGICFVVLIILIVRIVFSVRREKQGAAQRRREKIWKATFERCRASGRFVLTEKEIARFSASGMLRAFDALSEGDERAACAAVLDANSEALTARVSRRADTDEKGYFAYILAASDLAELSAPARKTYVDFCLSLVSGAPVFGRENALRALYNLGDAEAAAEAVARLSEGGRLHSEKLLADGLTQFRGDRAALAGALMARFDGYDDRCQSAVISFLSAAGLHAWDDRLKARLKDGAVSTDQRCVILRVLIKAPSEETKRILTETLLEKGHAEDWQTAAVAATGLDVYPGDAEVIDALRFGLTSPEWNVRMNSAAALVKLDPPAEVVDGILNGGDAFAADALKFALSPKGSVK